MSAWLGDIPAGSTLPVFFCSYDADGASVTLTGLAVTDIEIYKGASITQRSSDAGYALIDTDGIDVDGVTGLHAFSIDLADNTDSGFFAVGSYYTIVVSAVTIDGQTVTFIAGRFRIVAAEHTVGYVVATIKDGTGTGEIDTTSGGVLVAAVANGAITAAAIATGAIDADAVASDAVTEIQSGLATAANLATVAGYLDTEIAAILAAVDTEIGAIISTLGTPAGASVSADIAAVKAQTAAIETDTAEIGAAGAGLTAINLPNQTMDIVGNITGNLSGSVGSVTGSVGSLAAQAKADVNAEVVDALSVDTYAEPGQGNPAATAPLSTKIGFLYKAWRNRTTQDASEYALYADDATTKDQEAPVSDDGTTFDRGEVRTGA